MSQHAPGAGGSVQVLDWNISLGGGSQIAPICHCIDNVSPDFLALTEFQTRYEPSLREAAAKKPEEAAPTIGRW
jgi:hypothetical protein